MLLVYITLVLLLSMFRPVSFADEDRDWTFSCTCWYLWERRIISSTNSWDTWDQWMPVVEFSAVVFMIQSTTNRKNIGDRRYRCRTPVSTVNRSDSLPLLMTLILELRYEAWIRDINFSGGWFSKKFMVNAVKCLLEIEKYNKFHSFCSPFAGLLVFAQVHCLISVV